MTTASADFEYGHCRTDPITKIAVNSEYRSTDFFLTEPYATRVHAMLRQLGLPLPPRDKIFRGRHHDLLFLDRHGVVVRIGPLDVDDLLNPGILQPLGWLSDTATPTRLSNWSRRTAPLTVAVYPGIAHMAWNWDVKEHWEKVMSDLLRATGQSVFDASIQNIGLVDVRTAAGQSVAVPLLLDADNYVSGTWTSRWARRKRRELLAQEHALRDRGVEVREPDIRSNSLSALFNSRVRNIDHWQQAQQMHDPLRVLFWRAFAGMTVATGDPDFSARARFWQTCASVTNRPAAIRVPVWRMQQDAEGRRSYVRQEVQAPHVVLYRPWTGDPADQVICPIAGTTGKAMIDRVEVVTRCELLRAKVSGMFRR